MKHLRVSLLANMALCTGIGLTLYAQTTDRLTGTYSSLSYNRESGDLNGVELKIVPVLVGGGVEDELQGALQFSDSVPGYLMVVHISGVGNAITFSVPEAMQGGGEFKGVIDSGVLRGEFRFKNGDVQSVTMKKGKGYWD